VGPCQTYVGIKAEPLVSLNLFNQFLSFKIIFLMVGVKALGFVVFIWSGRQYSSGLAVLILCLLPWLNSVQSCCALFTGFPLRDFSNLRIIILC